MKRRVIVGGCFGRRRGERLRNIEKDKEWGFIILSHFLRKFKGTVWENGAFVLKVVIKYRKAILGDCFAVKG